MTTSAHEDSTVLDLASALYLGIRHIHSDPHALANPNAIPVLAELALSLDADNSPGNCQKAVTKLLHRALKRIRPFDNCSAEELGNAIAELLGIGARDWTNQIARFENAASELYAYSNGESLRKTSRNRSGGEKQKVWVIFYELLVDQLVVIATDADFTPNGQFMSDTSSRQFLPSRVSAVAVRHQVGIVEGELHRAFRLSSSSGGEEAVSKNEIPCIMALADALYPQGGTPLEKVEALFTWTARNARFPKSFDAYNEKRLREPRAQAILELAGFGNTRDLSARHTEVRVMELLRDRTPFTSFHPYEYSNERGVAVRAMALVLWELMNEQGIESVEKPSLWE